MTLDEKLSLVVTRFGVPLHGRPAPAGAFGSAGYAPGVPRLGIPSLQEADAGLGIANPAVKAFDATAMPSGLALAATFDPELAERVGAAVGAEARALGFDVLLGGGVNLVREARGGRAFEYAGEDPLLAGTIVGAAVRGAGRQGVVATLKHFALNDQENGRVLDDARLGEKAARESDLLAFEIALEPGRPGAVVAAYNRVDGTYASENAHLLDDVLKRDWGFRGWVMSDWGATHSTVKAAGAGLDQESGIEDDPQPFFGSPLKAALDDGKVDPARLDDMVQRILRSRIVAGQLDAPPIPERQRTVPQDDLSAHAAVAERVAEAGIVLLKNNGLLPLREPLHRLLVVSGHADLGVLSGGGSSQVVPRGAVRTTGEPPGLFWGRPKLYDPSPPLAALRRALPGTVVTFVDGTDAATSAREAADADAVVVFAEQWSNESRDSPDLALPDQQDKLIEAVAAANPRIVVVLETGHAVTMPWLPAVAAVLEAWYPGARGGAAIAGVLSGATNPSGRLPITFPRAEADLPRPVLPRRADTTSNPGAPPHGASPVLDYDVEGADVGYKWARRQGRPPLFPFGFGLSYTHFTASNLTASEREGVLSVAFDVANTGGRDGIATPQVYLDGAGFQRRLVAWSRVALRADETRRVVLPVDPRLLADYNVAAHGWVIEAGDVTLAIRDDALAEASEIRVSLRAQRWPAQHPAAAP